MFSILFNIIYESCSTNKVQYLSEFSSMNFVSLLNKEKKIDFLSTKNGATIDIRIGNERILFHLNQFQFRITSFMFVSVEKEKNWTDFISCSFIWCAQVKRKRKKMEKYKKKREWCQLAGDKRNIAFDLLFYWLFSLHSIWTCQSCKHFNESAPR